MTTEAYLRALKRLKLLPQSQAAAAALGVSVRQLTRYAAGDNIPETLAKLLRCYLRCGLE